MSKKETVSYGPPTIGPRTYLAKGPSGWPESFDRKATDEKLAQFLSPLEVSSVIETFLGWLRSEGAKAIAWSDVTEHLANVTNSKPDLVPDAAGVSLWAQTILHKRALEAGAN
jgi:hypothetical protein